MEVQTNAPIKYPEGLDETKLTEMLQSILDGIDRGRLMQDQRLYRVRHPLLQERIGAEIALNTEIHNLLSSIALGLTVSDKFDNAKDLHEDVEKIEAMFIDNASNTEQLSEKLSTLKDALTKLGVLNVEKDGPRVDNLVSTLIRRKLAMPNLAQDLILYPAVTNDTFKQPKSEILAVIEACRSSLCEMVEGKEDEAAVKLRREIEEEADFAKQWFEKSTLQGSIQPL